MRIKTYVHFDGDDEDLDGWSFTLPCLLSVGQVARFATYADGDTTPIHDRRIVWVVGEVVSVVVSHNEVRHPEDPFTTQRITLVPLDDVAEDAADTEDE